MRKGKLFEREWVAERLVQAVKETGVEGRRGAGTGRVRRCHRERGKRRNGIRRWDERVSFKSWKLQV